MMLLVVPSTTYVEFFFHTQPRMWDAIVDIWTLYMWWKHSENNQKACAETWEGYVKGTLDYYHKAESNV